MDDAAAGAVDDDRSGHHHGELVGADHALGFGRQRSVDGDEMRAFQHVFEAHDLDVTNALAGFDQGVVGDDVHAEADGFVGDGATDAAVSEDAEGCAAGSVHGLVEGDSSPSAGFDLGVVLAEAAVEGGVEFR